MPGGSLETKSSSGGNRNEMQLVQLKHGAQL